VEVFAEQYECPDEELKARVGLDSDDFKDEEVQELLEVYDEVKQGLDDDEEGDWDESEEEEQESSEEDFTKEKAQPVVEESARSKRARARSWNLPNSEARRSYCSNILLFGLF